MASGLRPAGDISPEELRLQIAAIAGPMRVPFGRGRPFAFGAAQQVPQRISLNGSTRPLYVEVVRTAGGGGQAFMLFGTSQDLSLNGSALAILIVGERRQFLLLPAEQLWTMESAGAAVNLFVSEVSV